MVMKSKHKLSKVQAEKMYINNDLLKRAETKYN